MPGDANNQGSNKPNPVTQGLLEKLGLSTQQEQPNPPTAPNASATAATTETTAHSGDVVLSHSATVSETEAHAGHVGLSQLPTEVEVALAAVRRGVSVEVNVSSCPGVCGGRRRGLRLSPVEYLALVHLRVVLGYGSFCDVLRDSRFSGLFCSRRGRVGGVVNLLKLFKVLKEVLRVGSREGPYAASYLFKRLYDGVPYYDFVDVLAKKVAASLANSILNRSLRGGVVPQVDVDGLFGAAEAMLNSLIWELGFSNLAEFAQYLQLIVLNLVEPRYANRHGGYRDILGATCRLCHIEFNTTKPVLRVLWDLTWHFKHAHGLKAISDVEAKVKEIEERGAERPEGDVGVKLLRHSGEVNQLIRLVVHRLVDRGLFERIGKSYRCRACDNDIGDAIDALAHVMAHHYDVVSKLLGERTTPSARGINETVDELANLFSSGNPDAVRHTVKALVQGIINVLDARGSASMRMLTRWLSEDDDYRLLLNSLTTGSLQTDRVVAVIIEALARHGLVQVSGEVVRLGE